MLLVTQSVCVPLQYKRQCRSPRWWQNKDTRVIRVKVLVDIEHKVVDAAIRVRNLAQSISGSIRDELSRRGIVVSR